MELTVNRTPDLSQHTTLRLGGQALAEICLGSPDELGEISSLLAQLGGRPLVIGRGSNILAAQGQLPVVLIRVPPARAVPVVVHRTGEDILLQVDAGMALPHLLGFAAQQGMSGVERLAGIPGTVGGAVAMNAGSYGTDMKSVLSRVLVFSPDCGLRWIAREEVNMSYRHFSLRVREDFFIILGAELRLRERETSAIQQEMQEVKACKKATQPITAATAGCIFKNPVAESAENSTAGRILDTAGYRGRRLGGMEFSCVHANFLVNTGQGRSEEAFALIEQAHEDVFRQYGIDLELEVKVIR